VADDDKDTLYKEGGVDHIRRIFPDDPVASVERPLFDSIAQEPPRLSGTPFRFYSVRRARARDPLYGEPSQDKQEWDFHGPWEMFGVIEYDQPSDNNSEATSDGIQIQSDATFEAARKEFEDAGAPFPKIGDVIEIWNENEFSDVQQRYWEVTKSNPDGSIHSSEVYVMWKMDLKRRTRFDPKRKIEGERI
jgi:hypothetical protein